MDQVQQAEERFVNAVRVLFDAQESIRGRPSMTPTMYDHYVTARLNAWITLEQWRNLRRRTGVRIA